MPRANSHQYQDEHFVSSAIAVVNVGGNIQERRVRKIGKRGGEMNGWKDLPFLV
jgi:hypothetical protein